MNHRVLLLNQSYEPIRGYPLKKALKHIAKNKVEVLHASDEVIYSGEDSWAVPTVVRLVGSNYINKRYEPRYTKNGIHTRDEFTCAYCGQVYPLKQLTIDHIIPKSKGGPSTWTNCITACKRCNSYKADLPLEEVKMALRFKPFVPSSVILCDNYSYRNHPDWLRYLGKMKRKPLQDK